MITSSGRVIEGVSYTQHDAPISNGNSGGPLINKYGEVIGINTWSVRESQNLNFAIDLSELNNLSYDTPLTMEELYRKECDAFTNLKNYIVENGSYSDSSNSYSVILDDYTSEDGNFRVTRLAYYYISSNIITLDMALDGGNNWAYFEIDESLDGAYDWKYFDDHNEMSGTLYAATYGDDALLGYDYNNISSSNLRDSIRELASSMVSTICGSINEDFAEIGVTAADLHFYNY